MSRWIALHCGDETTELMKRHPNAFLLATQIGIRARWKDCPVTGLKRGQAFVGDPKSIGMTPSAYRHAKKILKKVGAATFRGTSKGTIATLVEGFVYSVSPPSFANNNKQSDKQNSNPATSQRQASDEPTTTNHTDTKIHGDTERKSDSFARSSATAAIEKINSISSGWANLPVLSEKERTAYQGNAEMLEAVTDEAWDSIRQYYRARLPEGKPCHRPKSRERFITDLPDIAEYADQWKRSQPKKPKTKPKSPVAIEDEGEEMTPEQIKAFFGGDISKAIQSKS